MTTGEIAGLVSVGVIIVWNGFFVAAEYAFVSMRRTRLEELIAQGNRRARLVKEIQDRPARFIAAFQLAVTLSSLALGAVGEPAVSRLLEDAFGRGAVPGGIITYATIALILAFVLITVLHVVLGEIAPKSYTLARAEQVAMFVVYPVRLFYAVFGPLITLLERLTRVVVTPFGVEPGSFEQVHSEEELKMLVRHSGSTGVLEAEEQEMLRKVFDFADREVHDVMVPRPDVTALPVSLTPVEALDRVLEHPFTRYPVYGEDIDDVLGVVHVRSLIAATRNGGGGVGDLRTLARPAHVVPETKQLGTLLGEIRRTKSHMAIVVDEYGSLAGIVTLEDLIEEIVGEIADEFDLPEASVTRLGRDRVRVEGTFPIEEFNERFARSLPHEDYHTVGGIVFGELGRAPQPGDAVELEHMRFVVADVDGPRILHVDITFLPPPEPAEEEAGAA
jgi:CBS domain containing-hemolysin-like protein